MKTKAGYKTSNDKLVSWRHSEDMALGYIEVPKNWRVSNPGRIETYEHKKMNVNRSSKLQDANFSCVHAINMTISLSDFWEGYKGDH
jgi:hypothetical protein